MKNKICLMAMGFALVLINACQTPEERIPAMKTTQPDSAITSETIAADNTSTDNSITDTTTVAADNTIAKDSVPATINVGVKKTTKGKASVGKYEHGANDKMEMDKNGVYAKAEVMPSYPGGQNSLEKFVEDNLQYPQQAIDNEIEGRVVVSFDVDENGKIYRPMIISEKIGYGLEEEALKIVKAMPQWNPGKIKGKNVKTKFTLPISYQLL